VEKNKGRFVVCQMCNKRFIGYSDKARFCVPCRRVRRIKFRTIFPWALVLHRIKIRCRRSEWYRKMNIQCYLTHKETKELWIRDKADKMKQPSIDRIDNAKGYIFDNCRFIELEDNLSRRSLNADVLIDKNKTLEAIVAKLKARIVNYEKFIGGYRKYVTELHEEIARLKDTVQRFKKQLLTTDKLAEDYHKINMRLRDIIIKNEREIAQLQARLKDMTDTWETLGKVGKENTFMIMSRQRVMIAGLEDKLSAMEKEKK